MSKQRLGAVGLWTDPNPLTGTVPPGAMLVADDVVIRREGVVEPRPGLRELIDESADLVSIDKIFPFSEKLLIAANGYGAETYWDDDFTQPIEDGAGNPIGWTANRMFTARPEETIYLNTADGVRKLTNEDAVEAWRAGMQRGCIYAASAGVAVSNVLTAGKTIAYRVTFRRTENGRTLRGAPSGRSVLDNDSGANVTPTVRVVWHQVGAGSTDEELQAGDFVELWRSYIVDNTAPPSDDLFLAAQHEITSADLSTGYVDVTDSTLDADLGAALYTNPSQQGAAAENNRPPKCNDAAAYNGSMFFAGTTGPHRLGISYTEGGVLTTAAGIGTRAKTGTRTLGSATITAISDTTGLKVGMLLADASVWNGSGVVRIVSVDTGAGTVTMNETSAGNAVGDTLTFHDSVKVTSANDTLYFPTSRAYGIVGFMSGGYAPMRVAEATDVYAFGVGDVTNIEAVAGEVNANRTVYFESILPDGNGFTVAATHGDEFSPPLPEISASPHTSSTNDDRPHGIAWSKSLEYEHVPEADTNYALIGDGAIGNEILRLAVAQGALWIFMKTGLYRLSGAGARNGWRIDLVDPTLQLLAPSSVCVLRDVVYAWTLRGIVAIVGSEVVALSAPRFGSVLGFIEHGQSLEPLGGAPFAFGCERTGEVFFGVPATAGDVQSESIYVYNVRTRAFTRWFAELKRSAVDDGPPSQSSLHFSCGAVAPSRDGQMVWGDAASGRVFAERANGADWSTFVDMSYTVTVDSVDTAGTEITIDSGTDYYPKVGDALVEGGSRYLVTNVESATVFTVHAAGLAATDTPVAYDSYECAVEWTTNVDGVPSAIKHFVSVYAHLLQTRGALSYTMSVNSDRNTGDDSTATRSVGDDGDIDASRQFDDRVHVQRDHAKAVHLFPKFALRQGGAQFALGGITVEATPVSERTTR